jgi:SpoVK/Ycf46/Vps4 family AAA+-type ATPase
MADGRILRQLIKAGATGATEDFRRVAEKVIQEEREKKHHLLASDLERILYGVSAARGDIALTLPPVPVDRERKLPLLEVREPVRGLQDLVVTPAIRSVLDETLAEQCRRDALQTWGLRAISRLLFVGPPGCGKTLASEVLATELGIPWIVVRFDAVVSSFLGETAANLRHVFDYVATGRYLVLFDEFDAIAKEREDETEHGELRRVVSAFLQMMDSYRGESLLVAASNHEGMLDRALWRRFDEVLRFDPPDAAQVAKLLEVKLRGVRRDFELNKRSLPPAFAGLAHADIERVVIRAVKAMVLAGREFLSRAMLEQALEREAERRELSSAGSR